jgi:hypothetical protein
MMSMQPIDFASSIMSDMIHHIHTDRERNVIPFVRFTKMLIEHFCGNTPDYLKRMHDRTEPKDVYNKDFKIAFVKTIKITTKTKGMRVPDYFLDDNIRKT